VLNLEPTQLTLLPSQLSQLLLLEPSKLASLERVILSGEALSEALWENARNLLPVNCHILNLYGQTESTGDVLCADLKKLGYRAVVQGIVAVGTPILDCITIEVNDQQELTVSGNLSHGYLGRPPFKSFSTGDVGFIHDGLWYVRGRCGDVGKVNGVLTSPAEVEAAFATVYSNLNHSFAAVIYDGHAYIVSEQPVPFSRDCMNKMGIPWNLIPRRILLCQPIPVSRSGAGKTDRSKLMDIVKDLLVGKSVPSLCSTESNINGVIAEILNVSRVDHSKSFVENGGDSASAVTLLYTARSAHFVGAGSLTAADILTSDSIAELEDILNGRRKPKRRRMDNVLIREITTFVPGPTQNHSNKHTSVAFKACVDASPVLSGDGSSLYLGCQGGVIQKVDVNSGVVLSFKHFAGWMIQADANCIDDRVIFSLYKRDAAEGKLVALNMDLSQILWKRDFEAPLFSTPTVVGFGDLCVSTGNKLVVLNSVNGEEKYCFDVPDLMKAQPATIANCGLAIFASADSLARVEWNANGDFKHSQLKMQKHIGAVYKSLVCSLRSKTVFVASSSGSLHRFDTDQSSGKDQPGSLVHVSDCPLSAPAEMDGSCVVVGSYNGHLFCFDSDLNPVWDVDVGGSIYAKPLALSDIACVVCTTAGDIVLVCGGKIARRLRIGAEIWSDPVLLPGCNDKHRFRIAFGARDSRLHIVTIDR